jgi:hypothetical protein
LESELNRVLWVRDMAEVAESVGALAERAEAFASIFSFAAGLLSSPAASRRGKPADAGAKKHFSKSASGRRVGKPAHSRLGSLRHKTKKRRGPPIRPRRA